MMNLKTMMLSIMALGLLLGSCNKEENPAEISTETRGVKIKFSHGADTRAQGETVDAGDAIELKTGHLYFTSNNVVTKYMSISTAATDDDNLNIGELESATGITVDDVPDNSTQIYLFSNIPSTVTVPTAVATPIATLNAMKVATASMGAADGSVDNVSLYGKGSIINPDPSNPDEVREAEVEIHAMVSRIEIAKITGSGEVEDYKVAGIYMNYYYAETSVDGTTGHSPVDNGSDGTKYVNGLAGGYNFTNGILHDDFDVAPGTGALPSASLVVAPSVAGEVWAYNLLPATTAPMVPHIIIVLEDVTLKNADDPLSPIPLNGYQYLTVKGFKEGNTEITALEKGTVYKIADILFTENEITDQPEVKTFSVTVTLDLVDWEAKDVTVVW